VGQTKQLNCMTLCKNMIMKEDTAKNIVSSAHKGGRKSCVTAGQTKITQVVNYETKQLHCVTTPNQTIKLYDNM